MMMQKICFFFFMIIISSGIYLHSQNSYSMEEALKVLKMIEKVETAQMENRRSGLSQVEVTESEFNSYISYRIDTEGEEIMRGLQFKFLNKNKVEGKIYIDLRGQNLPSILKPEMNIFFSAEIETDHGAVRMDVEDLFIENRKVMPAVLDLIIAISAKLTGEEVTSIDDWYELPFGIKEIVINPGKAIFYY